MKNWFLFLFFIYVQVSQAMKHINMVDKMMKYIKLFFVEPNKYTQLFTKVKRIYIKK